MTRLSFSCFFALLFAVVVCSLKSSLRFQSKVSILSKAKLFAAAPTGGSDKTPLTANGKRIEVAPGSSLFAACQKLGLRVPVDCRRGECGVCTVSVGGQKIKSCM